MSYFENPVPYEKGRFIYELPNRLRVAAVSLDQTSGRFGNRRPNKSDIMTHSPLLLKTLLLASWSAKRVFGERSGKCDA